MKKILVAYTTNSGSTEEVAQAVAAELGHSGASVDVKRVEDVDSLEPYGAVVVGAPMILGWHRGARRFIRQHHQALSRVPVAYFCTAMSLTRTDQNRVDGTPVCVDSELAQPPAAAGRLSFKERYAQAANYVRPMLKTAPHVHPVSVGIFGGKLEMFRLKWWQMLFVMVVIRATPGDRRNWDVIREWAAGLHPLLVQK